MALIKCPECGGQVSSKATSCPHCGFPMGECEKVSDNSNLQCPFCGADITIESDYCDVCGMHIKTSSYVEVQPKIKYKCLKCKNTLPKGAQKCPFCGAEVPKEEALQEDVLYCPTCGGLNPIGSFSCIHCGRKYSVNDMIKCLLKAKKNDSNSERKAIDDTVNEKAARCPRCGSTSLTANKKGFGIGKATVGTLAFGLVPGLLIGNVGSKKIEVTCLKCGKKFKV